MWAQVGNNKLNLGFKSYTCYCVGLLDNGIIARTDASTALLKTRVTKTLLASIIAHWLGSHKASFGYCEGSDQRECFAADELYNLIVDKSYGLLTEGIKTPIAVTMACLLAERCSLTPKGLNHLAQIKDREDWIYTAIEELIQYPPLDKLDLTYVSIPGGALEFYIELAVFYNDFDILSESLVLEVIKEYTQKPTDINILNSIDEAGILINTDAGFVWSDKNIKNRLAVYPYKQRQWARVNKLVKQLQAHCL